MGIKKVFWIDESETIDARLQSCIEHLGLELLIVKTVVASDVPNIGESIFIVNTNEISQIKFIAICMM